MYKNFWRPTFTPNIFLTLARIHPHTCSFILILSYDDMHSAHTGVARSDPLSNNQNVTVRKQIVIFLSSSLITTNYKIPKKTNQRTGGFSKLRRRWRKSGSAFEVMAVGR